MARPQPHRRGDYPHAREITTRWMDNDAYGHVNNVVYYSFFDTTVNAWLIERGALDVARGTVVGFVVETGCHYFAPLSYPQPVTALFAPGEDTAAAQGHFIHVYVERASRRPVASLPDGLKRALEPLRVAPQPEEESP